MSRLNQLVKIDRMRLYTVHPKKYAHGFVVLCFVVVMQSFIMNSHEVFIHIHQGCFAGTGAIVRLLQCQWSKPDGYGTISQCITTTKHSKAKTVCIFLGIYCKPTLFAVWTLSWPSAWLPISSITLIEANTTIHAIFQYNIKLTFRKKVQLYQNEEFSFSNTFSETFHAKNTFDSQLMQGL